jgi:hypothetical protein
MYDSIILCQLTSPSKSGPTKSNHNSRSVKLQSCHFQSCKFSVTSVRSGKLFLCYSRWHPWMRTMMRPLLTLSTNVCQLMQLLQGRREHLWRVCHIIWWLNSIKQYTEDFHTADISLLGQQKSFNGFSCLCIDSRAEAQEASSSCRRVRNWRARFPILYTGWETLHAPCSGVRD